MDHTYARSFDSNLRFHVFEKDVFSYSSKYSLAHCVSTDLSMNDGIAQLFKEKFGNVEKLKSQGSKVGECAVLKNNGRFIYYLTTRAKECDKGRHEDLRKSLVCMKRHCLMNGVTHLAIPALYGGIDGSNLIKVQNLIREVFWDLPITLVICLHIWTLEYFLFKKYM